MLRAFQELGMTEISQVAVPEDQLFWRQDNQEAIASLESSLADVKNALSTIKRYDHSKKSFLTPKPAMSFEKLKDQKKNREQVEAAIQAAQAIDEKVNEIRQRTSRTLSSIAQLEPFTELDVPVEELKETAYTTFFVGFLPKDAKEQAEELVEKAEGLLYLSYLGENGEFLPAFLAIHQSVAEEMRMALKELAFSEIHFDGFTGLVKAQIAALNQTLESLAKEQVEQELQAAEAAKNKNLLLAYEDYLTNELEREMALSRLGATDSVNILEGYIRHYDTQKLEEAVSSITSAYYLAFSEPTEEDDAPTVIENKRILRPFEAVTDMYATPARKGIDPVYILAPFYFIFFGMMLSDAAYGILLSIGALLVLKLKKPDGMFRKVTGILAICGISTLIWGALFGGWFGIEDVQPLWFNPLNEPMTMLIVCLAIGFVHILVAMVTGFYMLARDGHLLDAIFDKGFWMLILLAVPVFLLSSTAGAVMAIIGAVGIVLTQGRHKKGIVKKLVGGLAGLYDVTSYLSDILSYSRIFGMALATSVIAMVFNVIAGMVMGNVIGFIFGIAILIVGHVFNLGINALGAYVHSCRLQYIESFNKFFEGGGRAFKPLGYRYKNYRIEN